MKGLLENGHIDDILSFSERNKITVEIINVNLIYIIIFTQPLRSGRIWHKVNL